MMSLNHPSNQKEVSILGRLKQTKYEAPSNTTSTIRTPTIATAKIGLLHYDERSKQHQNNSCHHSCHHPSHPHPLTNANVNQPYRQRQRRRQRRHQQSLFQVLIGTTICMILTMTTSSWNTNDLFVKSFTVIPSSSIVGTTNSFRSSSSMSSSSSSRTATKGDTARIRTKDDGYLSRRTRGIGRLQATTSDDEGEETTAGMILSPYHILYPFTYDLTPDYKASDSMDGADNGVNGVNGANASGNIRRETGVPLSTAIDLLLQSMHKLIDATTEGGTTDLNDLLQTIQQHSTTSTSTSTTIRIEQTLSHSIDPLCWLHANASPNIKRTPHTTSVPLPPMTYLSTAEGTMESAVYGSSYTITSLNHNTHDSSRSATDDTDTDNNTDNKAWELIQNLPMGSRVYGGGRFDNSDFSSRNSSSSQYSEEWKEFGRAIWILPAVELRRETTASADSAVAGGDLHPDQKEDGVEDGSEEGGDETTQHSVTTLSIHLHFDTNTNTLQSSARHVRNLLQQLSYVVSPPEPTTTLPPIVSRGYNDDAQEVFEEGVGRALDAFSEGDDLGDAVDDDSDDVVGVDGANGFDGETDGDGVGDGDGVSSPKRSKLRKAVGAALNAFSSEYVDDDNTVDNGNDNEMNNAAPKSKKQKLQKVVLARRGDLKFATVTSGLDILMKLKFGGNLDGHLFYINTGSLSHTTTDGGGDGGGYAPSSLASATTATNVVAKEFFGCTPERLFQVRSHDGMVLSEALAGTRPRGLTSEADAELLRDLMYSDKDRSENIITGQFIKDAFHALRSEGLLVDQNEDHTNGDDGKRVKKEGNGGRGGSKETLNGTKTYNDGDDIFFVRRLRHLQHICVSIEGEMKDSRMTVDVARSLLKKLHPTPAVGGFPPVEALAFLQEHETKSFDRGYYAGPFGYLGNDSADVMVAIRSALLVTQKNAPEGRDEGGGGYNMASSQLSVYAGAGIVPGSTVQGEWAETSYKLGVLTSLLSQSPVTLRSSPNPNVAWATAFIDELIRCGVTQFYICPGSRSTPLTAALVKAMRTYVGIVECISVHDERAAGFRALGYGRGANKPAAVITSSGTAVANLYPAVMEAGVDKVPLLLITADRPYENRDIGANQAVDQVKVFSSSYIRWFRDVAPPSDDIPVSLALSDANHAVSVSKDMVGPVHLNVAFRENLAPDAGQIRGDNRVGSTTTESFSTRRFTDVPGFSRWSTNGSKWMQSYTPNDLHTSFGAHHDVAAHDIANLISTSNRAMIVVGSLKSAPGERACDMSATSAIISDFAQFTGFPIFVGAQSAFLRYQSSAVIPYGEHILRHPLVKSNINPDLIIQVGTTLVSTEIQSMISETLKEGRPLFHVLLHPHGPAERSDPALTVSHKVSTEVGPFLINVRRQLETLGFMKGSLGSHLAPLVTLGRILTKKMPSIIHLASESITCQTGNDLNEKAVSLTEPQIVLALSQALSNSNRFESLFLSNSMPVRDAEFFLYPPINHFESNAMGLSAVATNRGASGIDGIISTATGYAEATNSPTTLLIGDLATIHDLNAFHNLGDSNQKCPQLKTVIVNNDGGGIFSFLPIAKHGGNVGFEDYFGTPTRSFSFSKGAEAFGLPFEAVSTFGDFQAKYRELARSKSPGILEAQVVGREQNVLVHGAISDMVSDTIEAVLLEKDDGSKSSRREFWKDLRLPAKIFRKDELGRGESNEDQPISLASGSKTLVLLHGWMGDKNEWDQMAISLLQDLPDDWSIISMDLPGHGESQIIFSDKNEDLRSALNMGVDSVETDAAMMVEGETAARENLSIETMARSVLQTLSEQYGLVQVEAICGYSLGGRVALKMKKICSSARSNVPETIDDAVSLKLISEDTKLILLGANPGDIDSHLNSSDKLSRKLRDDALAKKLIRMSGSLFLSMVLPQESSLHWTSFIVNWYSNDLLWGNLKTRKPAIYKEMVTRKVKAMMYRASDLANVLKWCSPARNSGVDWTSVNPGKTFFVSGSLDTKYTSIGKKWMEVSPGIECIQIENAGHALLAEAPLEVAKIVLNSLVDEKIQVNLRETNESKSFDNQVDSERAYAPKITQVVPGSFDFEMFTIKMDEDSKDNGVSGIGWGDQAKVENRVRERCGFIINVLSEDGRLVGIGEVSPLAGLHQETMEDAESQLEIFQMSLRESHMTKIPPIQCEKALSLDGSLSDYLDLLFRSMPTQNQLSLDNIFPSVRSGLEMALLSLASQAVRLPLPRALVMNAHINSAEALSKLTILPLNGLVTRSVHVNFKENGGSEVYKRISYPCVKVKVGHRTPTEDAEAILDALSHHTDFKIKEKEQTRRMFVRADANRAWNEASALEFSAHLTQLSNNIANNIEFIEEPIEMQSSEKNSSGFYAQVQALNAWSRKSGIKYALDESIADLVLAHNNNFEVVVNTIIEAMTSTKNECGCAAFVLKPAILGVEQSMRLSRIAHRLGIGAVFSSSFDSGVGLAYTAFLATVSDACADTETIKYSHGISTFSFLVGDTMSPKFETYVKDDGYLQVAPLARAVYGLGLDEMRDESVAIEDIKELNISNSLSLNDYQATSSISNTGREIGLKVSLPLPFSDDIACSRFTDLPQQPRWSPWLNSVSYLDSTGETEWTAFVKGREFRWKAKSKFLDKPKGIMWESTSGLKNKGSVEFIAVTEDSCLMQLKMVVVTPRILTLIFSRTGEFAKEFLESKILKWSLESFRDIIKADLALERGDAELGDALFGVVEGRTIAIKATLSQGIEKSSED